MTGTNVDMRTAYIKAVVKAKCLFVCFWSDSPQWGRASSFTSYLNHTRRHATVSTNLLDEWSARRRDLYLTTHNTHNWETSMPPVGFETPISAGERPQTYALDCADTGTGEVRSTHTVYLYVRKAVKTNIRYFPTQYWMIGFYKREVVCLMRSTDCVYIFNSD